MTFQPEVQLMKLFLSIIVIFLNLQVLCQRHNDFDSTTYYVNKGQITSAMPFAKRNFEAIRDNAGNDSIYIVVTSRLASIYYAQLKYDSALLYYINASDRAKKLYGETSAQHGSYLVPVATMYRELGQYEDAEQLFQNATAILKQTDDPYGRSLYVSCLSEYASLYITTGNLNKAEELCLHARDLAHKDSANVSVYVSTLEKLGRLYKKLRFYKKQEAMAMEIFEIYKEKYGANYYKYVHAIAGLADVYHSNQNLVKADSIYKRALHITQQATGKNSVANVYLLRHIGIVNTEMGKYEEAEKYLKEAMKIVNENGGATSPLYPMCGNNLARLYIVSGKKELAEPLFQKSLTLYSRLGLRLSSARMDVLYDMAALLSADDPTKAAKYLKEAMVAENELLLNKLDFLPETELLTYLKEMRDASYNPYRFLLHHNSPVIAGAVYNSRLLVSGIGLENTRVLYRNMEQSGDSVLTMLWKNFLQQKLYYTNLLLSPAAQRNPGADTIATKLNQQEKEILRRSAEYRDMKNRLSTTWQDVQKHLLPGETAIEFVKFNGQAYSYTDLKVADTAYYAALLLRPQDTAPQFVILCEENQLAAAMKKFPYKALINSRGQKQAAYAQNSTNALYRLLWQPLEPFLTHTKTVYFSPDGLLHRVAFAAIPYKNDGLLCDKYDLVQLTSTRQIALKETRSPAPISIAMFGGINYNSQPVSTMPQLYSRIHNGNRSADLDSFRFLPNTLAEINAIKKEAAAAQKLFIVFTGDNATESAFRNLRGGHSPEIIHFATHGFTLSDTAIHNTSATTFRASDNPLVRCGLVMTGGNKGWNGKAAPGEDDGILTGLEISNVQLPNTQLAVLSACETGLGKIEGSEGVFGLQRAFKLAGVNYIISSLWQVPDKETSEFMETFYACRLGGKTIREAFLHTQQLMRKKYAPYYWAGFTLVK